MKNITALSLAGLLGCMLPLAAAQADVAEIAKKCESCHGKDGNSEDGKVPNIAGMSEAYLKETMTAYASGDRPGVRYKPKDGEETDMNAVAKKLGDENGAAIAKYYAGKAFAVHAQAVDAGRAAKGKKAFEKDCEKCHSEGGSVAGDDASLLMGQWKPYLEQQFAMFDKGTRTMPKKMAKKYEGLDAAAKGDIIEYLASGKK